MGIAVTSHPGGPSGSGWGQAAVFPSIHRPRVLMLPLPTGSRRLDLQQPEGPKLNKPSP